MRLSLLVFLIAIFAVSCSKFAKVQKSTDYDYKLRMAEKYYVKKDYNHAQQLYEELFPIYKGDPKFEDIFYKYAYCSFYLKDWMQAENLFKQFVEVFPTSTRAEEMEFMRAFTFAKQSPKPELDQTNTLKAMGLMQAFINTHPGSPRNKEASELIDAYRLKLEVKQLKGADLYFDMGHFRAAAISYTSLMNDFPDSERSEDYKLKVIKSYYLYASNSVDNKKVERFETVISECNDFVNRFPESKMLSEVENFSAQAQTNIKEIQNEQITQTN